MQNTTFTSTTQRPAFRRQAGPIGGVAGGLAHTFDLDATAVRVALGVGLVFTGPVILVAYVLMWMLVPIDPLVPVADRPSSAPALLIGGIAVLIGLGIAIDILTAIPLSWIVIGGFVGYYFWSRDR